jgi:hypothetical protein
LRGADRTVPRETGRDICGREAELGSEMDSWTILYLNGRDDRMALEGLVTRRYFEDFRIVQFERQMRFLNNSGLSRSWFV